MKMIKSITLVIITLTTVVVSQDLKDATTEQGSAISKIMKGAGALLVKESHELKKISTTVGKDIDCEILVLRNLLSVGKDDNVTVGLILKVKEKYSSKTANVDPDEIDGLLASLELIEKDGLSISMTPIISPKNALSNSIEIHYRTKDNMVLGVYENKGVLNYAIKVSSTADWAFVTQAGISTLIDNLKEAKSVAAELMR